MPNPETDCQQALRGLRSRLWNRGVAPMVPKRTHPRPRSGSGTMPRADRSADLLSIVEAAYAVERSAEVWTRSLLDAADQSFGEGLAAFACTLEMNEQGLIVDRTSASSIRQGPEVAHAIFEGLARLPPEWLTVYLNAPDTSTLCQMTSEVDPNSHLSYRAGLLENGIADGINIGCVDLDRRGVLVSLGVRGRTTMTPELRQNLKKVGTHILAGFRLRRRLGVDRSSDSADAVLSADGKLLHAQGDASLQEARQALQLAARNIERARGTSRLDVPAALNLWKGLVASRWTLIDSFDAQGNKYIVARENVPHTHGLSQLTLTERCVVTYAARGFSDKEIAYTLGISDSTVRVLVMRSVRRCGLRDRDELLSYARRLEDES